jgi:GDP-L-fucose synthase
MLPGSFEFESKRVWVAGHRGMVGSALCRRLAAERCAVITCERREVDLIRQDEVEVWLDARRPDAIVLAAANVGGILASDRRSAAFLYDNLAIETNVVHAAHAVGVEELVFLGSSCIYPQHAEQPIREEALLTGPLEPTNEWYAVAKIAGLQLCEAYRGEHSLEDRALATCAEAATP